MSVQIGFMRNSIVLEVASVIGSDLLANNCYMLIWTRRRAYKEKREKSKSKNPSGPDTRERPTFLKSPHMSIQEMYISENKR